MKYKSVSKEVNVSEVCLYGAGCVDWKKQLWALIYVLMYVVFIYFYEQDSLVG